jgi:hypothetical protein
MGLEKTPGETGVEKAVPTPLAWPPVGSPANLLHPIHRGERRPPDRILQEKYCGSATCPNFFLDSNSGDCYKAGVALPCFRGH